VNSTTIVHPRLHHLGMTTSNADAKVSRYRVVIGTDVVHRTDSASAGTKGAPAMKSVWVTNDEANHRLAFVEVPGFSADENKAAHRRIQHFAFAYRTLEELRGTYLRLKAQGIVPVLCTDAGAQTAFYYTDPDGNSVELHVDNFGNSWTSTEYLRHSHDFAAKPIGHFVDPDKLVKAWQAGASASELSERAWRDEFIPDEPYDPSVLL
jgi:catechol 2,3-dioxygenase